MCVPEVPRLLTWLAVVGDEQAGGAEYVRRMLGVGWPRGPSRALALDACRALRARHMSKQIIMVDVVNVFMYAFRSTIKWRVNNNVNLFIFIGGAFVAGTHAMTYN